ncbi:shikimate dehydrogenase [Streptomyces rapamycinicus]|uniref:Shikimate dehydrogenase (NADP(+)) n=2 Tax=Streptomyces rapamycinicus TaxID=1226757 RepID=A0A3L8RRJ1_STRRN|nr:shikimate dehydrogenase [Streptomyces rapamycinicus]MBB4782857.1 shikimate dehydrogenase [Streptomyces rapamycinicus]RLV81663.1 shikimate dehydrogenase [Streptomyces rapamycinicus NRRL 5491]UTO63324.1 shikimate dehydrogenase [Streptomyces rapamycinicus]UTP31282.1 shikimate dehydrogenase [Streptomyces rapamycinicus NRRL 5491]
MRGNTGQSHENREGRESCLVGLIGSGVGPSLSPALHQREADRHGLRYLYRLIDIDPLGLGPDGVGELVRAAARLGFDGLNITHPCKQTVIGHLDGLSEDAALLGAVNTVVFGEDGRAIGHNTDWSGFARSFSRGLPDAPTGEIVLLGAGGAGAAVAHALLTVGADRLTLADTDQARAAGLAGTLATRFGAARVRTVAPGGLPAAVGGADGLVHATPTGMAAHPGLPLPAELLRAGLWVAEVVYRPLETPLLAAARAAGCRTLDGGGMAVFQAADAFRLFTGREPDATRMLTDLSDLLELPAGG